MASHAVAALQPIYLFLADLLDKCGSVGTDVSAQKVVTGAAGFVHVPEVEAQMRGRPYASEVRAMPLPLPRRWLVAANAS